MQRPMAMRADRDRLSVEMFEFVSTGWVTALASQHAAAPVAFMSLCFQSGLEYLSVVGLAVEPAALSEALRGRTTACGTVARTGEPLVINNVDDFYQCEELADLLRKADLRSYFGVPLHTPSGALVGALAVADKCVRRWSDQEVEHLEQLAAAVSLYLEWSVSEDLRERMSLALPTGLSHAIRTSMTGMQASLELLLHDAGELSEAQSRLAGTAHRKYEELASTIDQLLAIAEAD